MEINNIINFLKERAKKSMRRNGGELEPKIYFLILYPGQQTPVYFPVPCSLFMKDEFGKDHMAEYVQMAWYRKKSTSPLGTQLLAVCLVSDAWYATGPRTNGMNMEDALNDHYKKNPNWSPSKDPKRREVLILTICMPNKSDLHTIPYKRNKTNIEFGKEFDSREITELNGRMTKLFPKDL